MLKCNYKQDCIYANQGICSTCKAYEPEQTNADRIRSMSDEELLEFMIKTVGNAVLCSGLGKEPKFFTLEWLQSPASEN